MKIGRGIFFVVIIIIVFNLAFTRIAPGFQVIDMEQQLIEEILTLDARVLALKNEVEKLSVQNNELRSQLAKKQQELSDLNINFDNRQKQLSSWIVFSYKGGMGNMLSVLVGADDLGDFFRRLDNIVFFLEYYNNMIIETKALIAHRKLEERNIMEKQQEIQALEQQAKRALEKISQTMAQKQKELTHARQVLKDTAFLEGISEDWQKSLPSLDYLLKNLSSLPWHDISPDNLKVNFLAMTAQAEFSDASITKTLLSKDKNLKDVYFTFDNDGITVTENNPHSNVPIYSITCTMNLIDNQKVKFTPTKLTFGGVTLPAKVIKELMADYDMVFIPPPLPYDLKITSVETEKGKLVMNLKK